MSSDAGGYLLLPRPRGDRAFRTARREGLNLGAPIDEMGKYGELHEQYVEALSQKQTLIMEKDRVEAQEL